MIKLALHKEAEAFRLEFREWLAKNPPPKSHPGILLDEFERIGKEWQGKLASGNWVGVHWPQEFGGRGLSLVEEAIVQEELARIGSPQLLGLFGLTMVGPVLIEHGSQDQKKRFLSDILTARRIWCQGFSEPGAGSDLAAVSTSAKKTEGGYVLNGQKVWTSFAHIADFIFVLCRTSDSPKKHEGLSYLLLDMKTKGITTRPLKQISGDDEFNEVFFDEVFVPAENLVGQEGDGWKIAISTLMYERVVLTFARQLQSEVLLRELLSEHHKNQDPILRHRLSKAVSNAAAIRALAYEHLIAYSKGKKPGPEGSLDKLLWSESFQEITKLAVDTLGSRALGSEKDEAYLHQYLYSRGRTIAAGTSEIQRNIIAERLLGMPK